MQLPSNLQSVAVDIGTSATPNTTSGALVLAGPGAGVRTRVWSFGVAPNSTNMTLPQQLRVYMADNVSGLNLWALSFAGSVLLPQVVYFPGGLYLPATAQLRVVTICSVASQFYRVSATYTQEIV